MSDASTASATTTDNAPPITDNQQPNPPPATTTYPEDISTLVNVPVKSSAPVYTYFGIKDPATSDDYKEFYYCKLYSIPSARTGGCTGIVNRVASGHFCQDHLKTHHPQLDTTIPFGGDSIAALTDSHSIPTIGYATTWPELITTLFAEQNYSFSSIDHPVWKHIALHLHISPFGRKELVKAVDRLHTKAQAALLKHMADVRHVSFTTDAGSMQQNPYVTLTAHWYDADWNLRHAVLALKFTDAHSKSGTFLTKLLAELFEQWSIVPFCVVTDNGKNFTKAVKLLKGDDEIKESQRCAIHTLQLAIRDALKQSPLMALITKLKTVVAAFRHSDMAARTLSQLMDELAQVNDSDERLQEQTEELAVEGTVTAAAPAEIAAIIELPPEQTDAEQQQQQQAATEAAEKQAHDAAAEEDEADEEYLQPGSQAATRQKRRAAAAKAAKKKKKKTATGSQEAGSAAEHAAQQQLQAQHAAAAAATAASRRVEVQFREAEWTQMAHMEALLSPFREAGRTFEADKDATISFIIPSIHRLIAFCRGRVRAADLKLKPGEVSQLIHYDQWLPEVKQLATAMADNLHTRFETGDNSMWQNRLLVNAVMLDPVYREVKRWYSSPAATPELQQTDSDAVCAEFVKQFSGAWMQNVWLSQRQPQQQQQQHPALRRPTMLSILDVPKPVGTLITPGELKDYLDNQLSYADEHVGTYWRLMQTKYPVTATMARRILAVPASSASSERVFSLLRLLGHHLRASLSVHTVQKLVFLNHNSELLAALQMQK